MKTIVLSVLLLLVTLGADRPAGETIKSTFTVTGRATSYGTYPLSSSEEHSARVVVMDAAGNWVYAPVPLEVADRLVAASVQGKAIRVEAQWKITVEGEAAEGLKR